MRINIFIAVQIEEVKNKSILFGNKRLERP